jgi:hypothetical protein
VRDLVAELLHWLALEAVGDLLRQARGQAPVPGPEEDGPAKL